MSVFTKIFGDRYAQRVGEALLKHFESGDFPRELLHDIDLNLLYCEFLEKKSRQDGISRSEEHYDCLKLLTTIRIKELEAEAEKSDP